MSMRHKRVVATLDTGAAADWNDDHTFNYLTCLTNEHVFLGVPITVMWDTAQTAGGVAPTITLQDGHTFTFLDTGAGAGNTSAMRHELGGAVGNITRPEDAPTLTAAVWMEAYPILGQAAEFGFFPSAQAIFGANNEGAYFEIDANVLYAVTGTGAAETRTVITPATGIPEYGVYRIELEATTCSFYVTNMVTPAATHVVTLPTNPLTMKFCARNNGGVATDMYVDGVGLERLRYTG